MSEIEGILSWKEIWRKLKHGKGTESMCLTICNFLLSLLDATYRTTTIMYLK